MTSLREDTSFLDSRPVHVRPGCTCLPPRRHPPLPQRFGNAHPAHGVGAVEIGDGAANTQDPGPIPGSWFANTAARRWIWEAAIGLPVNVIRTFRTTFDLTGLDETTASLSGSWTSDNLGLDVLINGVSTGNTSAGISALSAFTINSGFVAGVNTLDFQVQDVGGIAGFMVSSLSGTAFSEPGMLAVFGLRLAGLGFARRRRTS